MPNKEKNSKDMYTSVSAITDADDCLRRWWLHKRCKLPQDQRQATIFGDVHHAVCARFLEADDRGIDLKTGKPVELYPEGWRVMTNRFDKSGTLYKVSDSEAALIKVLIQKAITDGVLVREPGRTVEREFETEIFSKGYAKVILKGFVDLDTDRGVEDHKTAKNKKYLLSKAKLKKSIQMMGYAYERYLQGHQQGSIWICHNGYVKDFDAPLVRKTDVEVTQIEVMDFFTNAILPTVKLMFKYYTEYPPARLNDWRNVPPANNANQSCNHHYGSSCPYVMICSGLATIDDYLRKYGMSVTDITGKIVHNEKGSQMNSLMTKIKQEQAAQAATTGAVPAVASPAVEAAATEVKDQPTTPPAVGGLTAMLAKVQAGAKSLFNTGIAESVPVESKASAVEGVTHVPVTTDKQIAPWYTFHEGEAGCPACKDNDVLGFNSKMEPCMICVSRARAAGKPCPGDFQVDVLEDGKLQFAAKVGGGVTITQVAKDPETTTTIQPIEEKPVATLAAEKEVAGTEIPFVSQDTTVFDIFVGCAFVKKAIDECVEMYADVLVSEMLMDISAIAEKPWATLDHFVLMQAIDAYVESLLPRLSGHVIISTMPSKGGAHARLIDGLRLHAASVICPLAG